VRRGRGPRRVRRLAKLELKPKRRGGLLLRRRGLFGRVLPRRTRARAHQLARPPLHAAERADRPSFPSLVSSSAAGARAASTQPATAAEHSPGPASAAPAAADLEANKRRLDKIRFEPHRHADKPVQWEANHRFPGPLRGNRTDNRIAAPSTSK
jgi:hypothetical protein